MQKITDQIKNLPDAPGVYFFQKGSQVLYVGKATSLRSRVKSYFLKNIVEARGAWIKQMTELADKIDHKQTDSVLEALILESAEIKKFQPPYNAREKDDKSYLYVVITDEDYPRVLTVRGRELLHEQRNSAVFTRELAGSDDDQNFSVRYAFGPFAYPSELREALKIIRRIFPYRTNCTPNSGKPCFDSQLGLCPGVCSGEMGKTEYRKLVRHLKLFFEGKKGELLRQLNREMKAYAKAQEFEKADTTKKQIFALGHIRDVALIKREFLDSARGDSKNGFRIEAYDVAHISGKHNVGAMVAMQDGEFDKSSYRKFKLRGVSAEKSNDVGNLMEIVERRLGHPEWPLPSMIVVDGSKPQINIVNYVLKNHGLIIPVVGVVKDEKHKAREVLGHPDFVKKYKSDIIRLNQEAHRFAITYHRNLRGRIV